MLRFADLFCGTGGIRLAFEEACKELGINSECVFSSEIDNKACEAYELNFGENPNCDIRDFTEIPKTDFLLAGFPCQTFSYAGKRKGFGDTRGTLFFNIETILKHNRPKFLLLENVRGLTTHDSGRTFRTILNSLNSLGYSTEYLLLNSSNFGVPQNRVRIYIVGVLDAQVKISMNSDAGPADTHKFKDTRQSYQLSLFGEIAEKEATVSIVSDILEHNPAEQYRCTEPFVEMLRKVIGSDFSQLNGYRLIDYRGGKSIHSWELGIKGDCSKDEIDFMNLLISNRRKKVFGRHQDGKSLTVEQILTFYHGDKFAKVSQSLIDKGYLSLYDGKYNPVCGNMSFEVFKFLDPDGISITLTASDSNRLGIVQNNIPRRITPRECARLQGYPDTYKLIDNDNAVYKQMGNGVSVPVVKSVLLDFLKHNFI